jgi:hypothetical protein
MSGPRSEIGALGFVRQNGLQRDKTSFRGVGGRPQGVDLARNPNHAPQKVSPKPWAMPAAPGRAPNEVPTLSQSLGTFLPVHPPIPQPRQETKAMDDSGITLAALAGLAPDAELREDLAACKGRLDAVGLRLSGQDNTVKALERSVAALREEYSKISQNTDGQSLARLEACERAAARLEVAFQEFSTEMQRAHRATENLIASQAQSASLVASQAQAAAAPVLCRLLEDAEGLNALEAVHLFQPLHLNAASDVCLYKRSFNPAKNAVDETDFVVQSASGDPKVVFV